MFITPTKKLATIVFLALTVSAVQAADIKVYVDGDAVRFDNQGPQMMNNRVFVPLRGVFERLGATVEWNENDQTIVCVKQSKRIWLKIGDRDAKVDETSVRLDQPALLYRGTTMVPLRFVSESLGADVRWHDSMQAVHITSTGTNSGWNNGNGQNNNGNFREVSMYTGTVIPVILDTDLSSNNSQVGDRFTATVGTTNQSVYGGLPQGTRITGHVSTAKAKTSKEPGVLAVEFDAILTPSGAKIPIVGSLIGLDNKSVENKDDLIVAKNSSSNNGNKSVWIGAGAGAVIALITKGNLLTDAAIGAALGYLYDQLKLGGSKSNDVTLNKGTAFGIKLDRDFTARIGA